jgi:hypothetical protein
MITFLWSELLKMGGALFVNSEEIISGWEVGHLSFVRALALPVEEEGKGAERRKEEEKEKERIEEEREEEEGVLVRTGKIKVSRSEDNLGGKETLDTYVIWKGHDRGKAKAKVKKVDQEEEKNLKFFKPTAQLKFQNFQMDFTKNSDRHGKYMRYFLISDPEISNCKLVNFQEMLDLVVTPSCGFDLEDVVGYDSRFV